MLIDLHKIFEIIKNAFIFWLNNVHKYIFLFIKYKIQDWKYYQSSILRRLIFSLIINKT